MGDKISTEILAERVANLQKEVEELRAWKKSSEKVASKITGAIMAVMALATAISFGFEKAVHKLLSFLTGQS